MRRGSDDRITMADIADVAGVSIATVSRALSGNRPMSEDLRRKVCDTASQLGYQVNLVGRTLRQQRSFTVGLIVPDLDNPFFSSLAQSLSRTFAPSSVELLLFSADSDLDIERRGIQSFLGRQVDALVIIATHEKRSAPNVELAGSVVTVELDRRVASPNTHFVGCDNRYGMRLVHEHVQRDVDVECQPPVFIGGSTQSSSGRERLAGFRKWFPDHPVLLGSFDAVWGQRAADEILGMGLEHGTLIAAADVIALGLISRLLSAGVRIPEDFRVVGFDGVGVVHLAHPTLTTVRQPVEEMSEAILGIVLSGAAGEPPDRRTQLFRPTLVYGESSPARA